MILLLCATTPDNRTPKQLHFNGQFPFPKAGNPLWFYANAWRRGLFYGFILITVRLFSLRLSLSVK